MYHLYVLHSIFTRHIQSRMGALVFTVVFPSSWQGGGVANSILVCRWVGEWASIRQDQFIYYLWDCYELQFCESRSHVAHESGIHKHFAGSFEEMFICWIISFSIYSEGFKKYHQARKLQVQFTFRSDSHVGFHCGHDVNICKKIQLRD